MAASGLLFPKLVVFGASGPTGRLVIQHALQKGHFITAVVRSPEKFDVRHENLEVSKGDVLNVDSLVPILEGKDAVLSCLGVHGTHAFKQTTLYSDSIKAISSAMDRAGLQRLVCITSWCTQKEPGNPKVMEYFLKPVIMRGFIMDMALMENVLVESNLCYTVVRPPGLSNDPATGSYEVAEGQFIPSASWYIPRADVANFMVKSLQSNNWDNKAMAIGVKK